jgi:hypothetical protein
MCCSSATAMKYRRCLCCMPYSLGMKFTCIMS